MSKVNLCMLVDTLADDAGTEKLIAAIVPRINAERFSVHVCCLENSERLEMLAHSCATAVFPVRSLYSLNGGLQIWRFRQYLNEHQIDVMHAFMVKTAIFGVLAAKQSRCPCIITSRLSMGYWYTPFYVHLFRYLNRHTTRVLANSNAAKRATVDVERIPPDKVDVIYNGVDCSVYSKEQGDLSVTDSLGLPPQTTVVGIVANLRPVKDIDLFLRAAALVSQQVPDAAFLIVGQGPLRDALGRLAEDLGIAAKVFFSDGKGTVPDYLCRMSIGCLSSRSESFSNALLEYMAAGLPVVATDVGGNAEAIEDGVNGLLVRERTQEALAAAMIRLLLDEQTRMTMARKSLARGRRLFDISGFVKRLEAYYWDLSKRP